MKTDNELIAEFMGLVRHGPNATYNLPQWYKPESDQRKKGIFMGYEHQLDYATSWDWLMPVVEKIAGHDLFDDYVENLKNQERRIEITLIGLTIFANIEMVYKAVVDFIEWLNKHIEQVKD